MAAVSSDLHSECNVNAALLHEFEIAQEIVFRAQQLRSLVPQDLFSNDILAPLRSGSTGAPTPLPQSCVTMMYEKGSH